MNKMIVDILNQIKLAKGSIAKSEILQNNSENEILKKVLRYGLDSFMPFNIVKVPKTTSRHPPESEGLRWQAFFDVADLCATRAYTGNFAIQMMQDAFCVAAEEERGVDEKDS